MKALRFTRAAKDVNLHGPGGVVIRVATLIEGGGQQLLDDLPDSVNVRYDDDGQWAGFTATIDDLYPCVDPEHGPYLVPLTDPSTQ